MFKRILGFLMLIIAIVGIVLSVAGTYVVWNMIDGLGDGIDAALTITSTSLDTVADSLVLTKSTVADVTDSVDTVQITTANLSSTISETRPLLNQVTLVASEDIPNSLDAVQGALPNVAAVAGSIDDALTILSAFEVNQSIVGVNFGFDLGIDYNPEQPFDESITQIGDGLDGLPERLRALEPLLSVTTENLTTISTNIETLATDLGDINDNIEEVQPLLDDYLEIVYDTNDLISITKRGLRDQLKPVKTVVMILFIWIGLTQIAPLYLGFDLLSGGGDDIEEDEVEEIVQSMMEASKNADEDDEEDKDNDNDNKKKE